MATIYCLSCKEKRVLKTITKGTTKNGQPLVKGKCPECNRTLTKFVSKKEQSAAAPAESKKATAPSKSKKVTPDMEELPKSKPKLVRTKAKKQVIDDGDSD